VNSKAKLIADKFKMMPHPEGGYFKEMYKSDEKILSGHLPERYGDERKFSTAIYFMLADNQFSALHRIKSDELWHFYSGSSLTIYVIDEKGNLSLIKLGVDFEKGDVPQAIVKRNYWFGAHVNEKNSYSFVGCTVAPGFHFDDFEMGDRKNLLKLFPQHEEVIIKLTDQWLIVNR